MTDKHSLSTADFGQALGRSRTLRARIVLCLLLIAVYLVLEWFSFLQDFSGLPVSPWNPGLGVVFAFILARGWFYGGVLFVGILLAELVLLGTTASGYAVVLVAAISSCIYTAAAYVVRIAIKDDLEFDHVKSVAALIVGGAGGAMFTALILYNLFIGWETAHGQILLQMFIGDAAGIAVMTPLTLRLLRVNFSDVFPLQKYDRLLEVPLHVFAHCVALFMVTWDGFGDFYVLVVPIVVTAARFGYDGACVAVAGVQFGLGAILHALGADANVFFEFQSSLLALTIAGLLVGAEVNARMRSERLVKEAEARLQDMKDEATQAGRLALVESMASSLAHEINQPMTAARALLRTSQVLMSGQKLDLPRAEKNVETAILQIDHAANVLRRMREFLKRRRLSLSWVSTRELLNEALILSRTATSNPVTIEADPGADDVTLAVDRIQIQQVFLNLIRNAVESIESDPSIRGRVIISARRDSTPERVEFSVLDNGPGIDPERHKHVFEPMRSSKDEGLGLGLAICLTIIEAHGGKIWLHSGQAGSTEFRFWIPVDRTEGR